MNATVAFRLARLIAWTGLAIVGAVKGNMPLMAAGIGGGAVGLVTFALAASREP